MRQELVLDIELNQQDEPVINVDALGFNGSACQLPVNKLLGIIGGKVTSNVEKKVMKSAVVTHAESQ